MYLFFFAPISVHQIHVLTGFNASKKKKSAFQKYEDEHPPIRFYINLTIEIVKGHSV